MTKQEARKLFHEKRMAISDKQQGIWDDLILIRFQEIELQDISTVLAYASIASRKEISTDLLVDYLRFRSPNLKICYPVTDNISWKMKAVYTDGDTFFENASTGIPEPETGEVCQPELLDLVFVPLLAFDKAGYRVGYGKGVYDKYLKYVRSDAVKIGLSYFAPIDCIENTNEFDVPLDYCVTPHGTYAFDLHYS